MSLKESLEKQGKNIKVAIDTTCMIIAAQHDFLAALQKIHKENIKALEEMKYGNKDNPG